MQIIIRQDHSDTPAVEFTSFVTDEDIDENRYPRAAVKVKFDEIEKEIASLEDHPWAGLYYQGAGLGANLTLAIAPKSGFAFTWYGCLGLYDQNYGEITEEDGRLKFSFALENAENQTFGIPAEFLPVPWGERLYLIPPDEMIEFSNEINSRREPRNEAFGQFFMRVGDWEKEVQGQRPLFSSQNKDSK